MPSSLTAMQVNAEEEKYVDFWERKKKESKYCSLASESMGGNLHSNGDEIMEVCCYSP